MNNRFNKLYFKQNIQYLIDIITYNKYSYACK